MHSINNDRWDGYGHGSRYNPHGRPSGYRQSNFSVFQLNHLITNSMFYELKISSLDTYNGDYVFKDKLYFNANSDAGKEPWVSDGTVAGTKLLKDVYPKITR